MGNHLDIIVELNQALGELARAEAEITGIPDWMRELHAEHGGHLAEIQALDTIVATAATERRAAEALIGDTQEKLKHYQQQMSLVSTQREYGALLKEIDTTKASIGSLEEEAFAAMERHEKARKDLAERQAAFGELDARYAQELARWEAEKPALKARTETLRSHVESLREQLPRALYAQFERVRGRITGDPLAEVKKVERVANNAKPMYSCGACNFHVRPQVVVEIRNTGSLIQCDSCKRILFVREEGG
jgi:predicted  nucleic acid-binding Zn-ribbon protein